MLKTLKFILVGIYTLSGLFILTQLITEYDQEVTAGANYQIRVGNWDQRQPKAKILGALKSEAVNGNYPLVQVHSLRVNNQVTKSVYQFNSRQQLSSAYTKKLRVKEQTDQEVLLSDLNGDYFVKVTPKQLVKLKAKMKKLGLEAESFQLNFGRSVTDDTQTLNRIPIFLSLLSVILIIMILEKIANFKSYAIKELNGWSKSKIILHDFKSDWKIAGVFLLIILGLLALNALVNATVAGMTFMLVESLKVVSVFLVIALGLDFGSYASLYAIELVPAIKGDSPTRKIMAVGYLIKLFLLILVSINAVSLLETIDQGQKDRKIISLWENRHAGYVVGFSSSVGDDDELLKRNFHQLLVDAPEPIIACNSARSKPAIDSISVPVGNVILANDLFLKYNPVHSIEKIRTSHAPDEVSILIPASRFHQRAAVIKDLKKFHQFQNELPNAYPKVKNLRLQVIKIKDQPQVFNYTVNDRIASSISNNPILIVSNPRLFSDDFYLAYASQGTIQFHKLTQIQSLINKYDLGDKIAGLTDTQTTISEFNQRLESTIISTTIILILSLVQLGFIILFVSNTFLLEQRQKMVIYTIFGQSNRPLIVKFIGFNVLSDFIVAGLIGISQQQMKLSLLVIPYLIAEAGTIVIYSWRAQNNLKKTINHGQ